jgi:hypothetical protein
VFEGLKKKSESAYAEYRKYCEAIEALHTKSENNPALKPDFVAMKAGIRSVQDPALEASLQLNEGGQDTAVAVESFLLEFEEIDRAKYEELEQLFKDLSPLIEQLSGKYHEFVTGLESAVQGVTSLVDVSESVELEPTGEGTARVAVELPQFEFDVTALPYVNVRELFDDELKKYRGKVSEDAPGLSSQELVTVISKDGAKLVVEKSSGETCTVPEAVIEKVFDRKLAKLNEAFERLRVGETVVVIEEPASAACIVLNVFRETFVVPASKLSPV